MHSWDCLSLAATPRAHILHPRTFTIRIHPLSWAILCPIGLYLSFLELRGSIIVPKPAHCPFVVTFGASSVALSPGLQIRLARSQQVISDRRKSTCGLKGLAEPIRIPRLWLDYRPNYLPIFNLRSVSEVIDCLASGSPHPHPNLRIEGMSSPLHISSTRVRKSCHIS